MSSLSDFVIENGILTKYVGQGGDVVVPEGVTSIGEGAFYQCSGLRSITIPEGVTSIGGMAFRGCENLTEVNLPKSLDHITMLAFQECHSLNSIVLPEGLRSIDGGAFFNTCVCWKSVSLPGTLETVSYNRLFDSLFVEIDALWVREWTPAITKALKGCTVVKLHTEDISKVPAARRIAAVLGFVSEGSENLASDRAKSHLAYIRKNNTKLSCPAMDYPELLLFLLRERLLKAGDADAYLTEAEACQNQEAIAALRAYQSDQGAGEQSARALGEIRKNMEQENLRDFGIENGVLKRYLGSGGAVKVPERVTSIGEKAFWGRTELTGITLPDGVTEIGEAAFYQCENLTEITLPAGLTNIGKWAFDGCEGLRRVSLPEDVALGDMAFRGCKGLADENGMVIVNGVLFDYLGIGWDVVVPEGVKRIASTVFRDWENMTVMPVKHISLPRSLEEVEEEGVFAGVAELTAATWSPAVTKAVKGSRLNKIHIEDISKVPAAYLPTAVLSFVSEAPSDLSSPRAKNHMDYLRRNAGKLSELAMKHPDLLHFLLEHKIIKAKDMDTYTAKASEWGDAEAMAALLNYQNELGTETVSKARDQKERSQEKKVDQVIDRKLRRARRAPEDGIEGLVFAVTGELRKWNSRKEVKAYLESYGAKLGSGITSKTDYLVTNDADSDSGKANKARELGVDVISEDQFNEMVGRCFPDAEEITVPSWLTRIVKHTFQDHKLLKRVVLPEGITEIEAEAFVECYSLTDVYLPAGVTDISRWAFTLCRQVRIHAPAGSYAEGYARRFRISYIPE